jgi:hypothetical protein
MTDIRLSAKELVVMLAMHTIVHEIDRFAEEHGGTEALFEDMEATVNSVMPAVLERAEQVVLTWDADKPPDVLVGFDHRHSIATSAWLDGLFAGVRWQRIITTGTDRRQGK